MKKIFSLIIALLFTFTSITSVFASDLDVLDTVSNEKLETDKRLEEVFDYLNQNDDELDFTKENKIRHSINVDGEIIDFIEEIIIDDLPSKSNRSSGYDEYNYSVNTRVTYRLTINPIAVQLGGKVIYTQVYTTTTTNGKMSIRFDSSEIYVSPPAFYDLSNSGSTLTYSAPAVIETTSFFTIVAFKIALPFTYNIDVNTTSFGNGLVRISWDYNIF